MKTQRAAVWALVVAALGGCAVDQNKEVQQYRREVDLQGAVTATTLPSAWPAGQVLTLREALLLTNQQNERLSIEGENYLQALIARKRAVGVFLPTVDANGAGFVAENVGGNTANHGFDGWLNGNINIFNGFRDVANLRASELTVAQRRAALASVQESLLTDVVNAYQNVLRNEAQVKVLESSVALQEARVRDITQRQQAGLARSLDVAQTQAQLSSTRVSLINAQVAVKNSRQALVLLTNAQVAEVALEDRDPLPPAIPDLAELRQRALTDRPDLQAEVQARAAARKRVDAAIGQYYPSASVNLQYFLTRDTMPDDRSWNALLQLNLPIFSAGQIEADVRQAWSQFRQAALSESLLRRQVLEDVERSYANYDASGRRLTELKVEVEAARLAMTQADASYGAGLATNLERLTSQDQYLSAQLGETSEVYTQRTDAASLLQAVGGVRQWVERVGMAATQPSPAAEPATSSSGSSVPTAPAPTAQ